MTRRARILCRAQLPGGKYHHLNFHSDGTVTSSGCGADNGDITSEVKRLAALASLGKSVNANSCVGLAVLVLYGIPALFASPGEAGEDIALGAWSELYQRFESNKAVQDAIKRERRKSRKARRQIAEQHAPPVSPTAVSAEPSTTTKSMMDIPLSTLSTLIDD